MVSVSPALDQRGEAWQCEGEEEVEEQHNNPFLPFAGHGMKKIWDAGGTTMVINETNIDELQFYLEVIVI